MGEEQRTVGIGEEREEELRQGKEFAQISNTKKGSKCASPITSVWCPTALSCPLWYYCTAVLCELRPIPAGRVTPHTQPHGAISDTWGCCLVSGSGSKWIKAQARILPADNSTGTPGQFSGSPGRNESPLSTVGTLMLPLVLAPPPLSHSHAGCFLIPAFWDFFSNKLYPCPHQILSGEPKTKNISRESAAYKLVREAYGDLVSSSGMPIALKSFSW